MNNLSFNLGNAYQAPIKAGDVGPLISNIISVSLVLSGILIVFAFIFGGIGLISSAGSNNPEAAAKGKKTITYAVIGFIVVFTAFWVIRYIEIVTGSTFITNPSGI